jgi:tetratricopeptide (TPR) repeat protein
VTTVTAQDRYIAGLQLFRSGNYHLTEKTLKDAIALDPAHDPSHALLALTLHYLGRNSEALAVSGAALAIRPSVDALRARALASVELSLPSAAVTAAAEAVALMPTRVGTR